jgi:hypothetical protein
MYSCPECEQLINQASEICPYCGADQKALADTELLLAGESMAAIQQAINTYQQSEGSAPPSLETLGDTVRKAAQSAQLAHYTLQYAPGKPDPAGRVTAYTLTARAGNFGYRSFYTDESATLRATTEDRAATVQDPPLNLQP